jgi:hypothetical protein
MIRATPSALVGHLAEDIDVGLPTDRISNETCLTICTGITNAKLSLTFRQLVQRVSITNSLSSFFHLRMRGSDFE